MPAGDSQGRAPSDERVLRRLRLAELTVAGRLLASSNVTFLVRVETLESDDPVDLDEMFAIYKPVRGERPLWDFPEGTLAGREVAAHEVSHRGGWHLVPPTVWRDGPGGVGSVQLWIGDPEDPAPDDAVVDLCRPGDVPAGWLPVFEGETADGEDVTVVHADAPDVRSLAVLDAVLNNSDRKGSHCLRDEDGRLWGIDHGVALHNEPKLRTVLWGWAGEQIPEPDLDRLATLRDVLIGRSGADPLDVLLPEQDVRALLSRTEHLLRTGLHPDPAPGWPAVPWPPL